MNGILKERERDKVERKREEEEKEKYAGGEVVGRRGRRGRVIRMRNGG